MGDRKKQKYCQCHRKALFFSKAKRKFRRDRDHELCMGCYRRQLDRHRNHERNI